MSDQPTLEGLEFIDAPITTSLQVQATRTFLKTFFTDHDMTPKAELASKTLLSIASNVDTLNMKGRDVSRMVDQFNQWLDKLTEIYTTETPAVSEELAALLNEFAQ